MRKLPALILVGGLLLPFAASGQSLDDLKSMSPEDRRAYIESMSENERMAMREKWRAERRARWDSMSEEERAAVREKRAKKKRRRGQRNCDEQHSEGDTS